MARKYNHRDIEKKWQDKWLREKVYRWDPNGKKPFYILVELAYTSGNLHMGHWFAWTAPDIYARLKRMQGENVLFPVGGFDAFGLPAENAAIKHGVHPRDWTYKNIETMRRQFETMGPSFDWEKEVITCDPEYYKWTQWLFLQMYKKGLAYQDEVWSNWCPECKTVLANEHVENGCCWRHTSTPVEQKKVRQWLFRITKYADRLIWPKNPKVDWPQAAVEGQNNWIGKSEGVVVCFPLKDSTEQIKVFTTRPDTIFGATFLVLAPEHPLALKVATDENKQKVSKYIEDSLKKLERTRLEEAKEKTGVFTGSYAVNPFSGEEIPIWVADFVLGSYGMGAIMGVPAHDKRDFEFAKKFGLDIRRVIEGGDEKEGFYEGEGVLINSGEYNGLRSEQARKKIVDYILEKGFGERSVQYHLRDWTISRQRYWGAPIPIVYCENCGTVPVPEEDLPVLLPENVDYTPTGKPPLATAKEWVKTKCPKCGREARREVETMDTYVDSSWYFFRYPTPDYKNGPFDPKVINRCMPIKIYFGGPEHILGHTLYARFVTKFLYDLGLIKFDEFASKRFHHGVILGPDGYRMSKSRGNVVNPDEQVKKFGADSVRVYIAFLGPHDKGGAWRTEGIEGSYRFLNRVWRLFNDYQNVVVSEQEARRVYSKMHKTIQKVTKDIEDMQTNTALAAIMGYVNLLREIAAKTQNSRLKTQNAKESSRQLKIRCAEWEEALKTLCLLLAPFAPHMTEEIWQLYFASDSKFQSIHLHPWPKYNPELIEEDYVTIVVQVNGKLRGTIEVEKEMSMNKSRVIEIAKENEKIKKWIEGKKIIKELFVPGKLVNFVV